MSKENSSKRYWLHYGMMLALILVFWFLPAGGAITAMGMKAIGIFAGLIYGWIFIDLI